MDEITTSQQSTVCLSQPLTQLSGQLSSLPHDFSVLTVHEESSYEYTLFRNAGGAVLLNFSL